MKVPAVVNCRDRVTTLRKLVEWLRASDDISQITLLDNDSTYPPLLEYYEEIQDEGVNVLFLEKNLGSQALWRQSKDVSLRQTPFIYTDPDILPDEQCPMDLIEFLIRAALMHGPDLRSSWNNGRIHKIGPGLRIDDLPDCYDLKESVIWWEKQFWTNDTKQVSYRGVDLYDAAIDTTMALYLSDGPFNLAGVRTGPPYVARHTAWYIDSAHPTAEQQYYDDHCVKQIASWGITEVRSPWIRDRLPSHLLTPAQPRILDKPTDLTVVVPVIQTQYLYQLLSFIRKNTAKPDEIIIIDNNNRIAEKLIVEFRDLNLTYMPQTTNLGVNASWNLGIQASKTQLISILNDDIVITKYFFQTVLAAFEKRAEAGIVIPKTMGHPDDVRTKRDSPQLTAFAGREGWAFTARRGAIDLIPSTLHSWCGDDYLFHLSTLRGYKNFKIDNLHIYHYVGVSTDLVTRKNLKLPEMQAEVREWQKIRSVMKP